MDDGLYRNTMNKAPIFKKSRMSWEEALKVFEMSGHPNMEKRKSQYKKLAKKYHPDLNPNDPEALNKFKRIQEAAEILGHEPITKSSIKEEYDRIKKIIPPGATDQKIDIIIAKEIDRLGKKSPANYNDISDKLLRAGELYKSEKERTNIRKAYIPARARGIAEARTIEAVKWGTPELRMIREEQKEIQRSALKRQNAMILERVKRVIHGKPRVPVIADHPNKKKKIIRWIILTASLATAIIAGKYLYNHYHRAFRNKEINAPPKLLTQQKVRK